MKSTSIILGILFLTMATLAQRVPQPPAITTPNRVLTAEERRISEIEKARKEVEMAYQKKLAEAERKWKAATNSLGARHHILTKNPFRLIKPEIEKPMPIPLPWIPVPQLAGIVRINSRTSALLRISPPSDGPAEYKFIGVGEMLNGVEVMRIDLKRDIVEVKIRNRTYSLELDKNTVANSGSTARPSGSGFRQGSSRSGSSSSPLSVIPSRGSSSSSRGTTSDREKKLAEWRKKQEEARKAGGSGTSPSRPSGSSKGGLDGVPSRSRGSQKNTPPGSKEGSLKAVPSRGKRS